MKNSIAKLKQKGFSLIELMVTLVLVSFLAIAMIMIFLSGRTSFLTQDQVGRLQENGRYAFHLMTRELQRAGYQREVWEPPAFGFAFTANTVDGGGTAPDTIELQYESDRDCNDAFNTVTENIIRPDTGASVAVPAFHLRLISFSVVDNQLMYSCSYGPVNTAPTLQINAAVADGVENLQIQFGEDMTTDFSVNQWVDGGAWNNFANVVSVRVAMVVRTPEEFAIGTDNETFDLYGTTTAAAGDQRIRRVFSGQVSARNLTL